MFINLKKITFPVHRLQSKQGYDANLSLWASGDNFVEYNFIFISIKKVLPLFSYSFEGFKQQVRQG
jgi:hypothetical protein